MTKILIASAVRKISVHNHSMLASVCKHCGARIYPLTSLRPHLERHARRALVFEKMIRTIR
jgi:hypothetical protein